MNIGAISPVLSVNSRVNLKSNQAKVNFAGRWDDVYFRTNRCYEEVYKSRIMNSDGETKVVYTGVINDKLSQFVETYEKSDKKHVFKTKDKIKKVSGNIGDARFDLKQVSPKGISSKPVLIAGVYNQTPFELDLKRKNKGELVLSGGIDNESVEFAFPGSKVPQDKDTKDIITTVLMLNGYKPVSAQGEFAEVKPSRWKREEELTNKIIENDFILENDLWNLLG